MPLNLRLSLVVLAAALAGCATTATQTTGVVPGATQALAPYRDTIELSGRIQVNYQKDGQPGNVTGGFEWSQQPGKIDVSLISPLKQTMATINVTPQQATLTEAGRAPRTASDIDALTRQALGWSLPVSGLRDWLQGYATDAAGKRFAASPPTTASSRKMAGACVSSPGRLDRAGCRCRKTSLPSAAPPPPATSWRSRSSSTRCPECARCTLARPRPS